MRSIGILFRRAREPDGSERNAADSRLCDGTYIAIHDAFNAIARRYRAYAYEGAAPFGASPDAAVAAAAHDVLVVVFPNQKSSVDTTYARYLTGIPDGNPKTLGIAVGQAAVRAILALRKDDGSASAQFPWTPTPGPGVWEPTPRPLHLHYCPDGVTSRPLFSKMERSSGRIRNISI